MAININNLNNTNTVNSNTNKLPVQQNAPQSSSLTQASAAQDSVSITPQAQKLVELQTKNNNEPQVDSRKVEELRNSILNGEYRIDNEKLAANIAEFEFELD